ncbi:MAG: hypothetical protein CBC47_08395 [Alphaproteobacteria bacterium TMED87]|nr:hypothetical protein [Rhodospirillaceae bacterium]OUV07933.1 MAG: hypothetical protein CBC47_08395 [Alphaproteobacteria bacterium TMED87]
MRELSKHISTFAFCYAAIYCFVEGMDALSLGNFLWSCVCFIFAFLALLAVFRFQIERIFNRLKNHKKVQ